MNTIRELTENEKNLLIYASMGELTYYRVAKVLHIHQATAKKLAEKLKGKAPIYELASEKWQKENLNLN